ncbi:hypothetical protein CLTEP_18030 [Clostridium tepidiprofundi DSM 19306]|uniref:Uncharacterized protein n=1 Tax=Clostridium tepidiprofundi DSM 19306 TaxID=1121338 RepID=A0A151B2T8_9CLOT|nr:glucosaminidase domain-containing protein [Clostridium tepidiprofundi]KYH34228.1 hypothetical protein CLTEP_18030 [Clostridium tepidiprofundi DSM 19306]
MRIFDGFSSIIQTLKVYISKFKKCLKISKKSLLYMSVFIFMSTFLISLLIFENEDYKSDNYVVKCNAVKKATYIPKQSEYEEYYEGYISVNVNMRKHPWFPENFNYHYVNEEKLLKFLEKRDSKLAEEPYFSTIICVSKQFNINPLLLFAIAGQEQGFVPKSNKFANKIANNPFNVFSSWQEYNTNIYDSTIIAAKTIINLSKDKPDDVELLEWINKKYAEDKNWSKGVKMIFDELNKYVSVKHFRGGSI